MSSKTNDGSHLYLAIVLRVDSKNSIHSKIAWVNPRSIEYDLVLLYGPWANQVESSAPSERLDKLHDTLTPLKLRPYGAIQICLLFLLLLL